MQLKDKIAIVVGAGQSAGETIGNGRATAIRFARAGAQVLLVDKDVASAEETARMIAQEKGSASVLGADIAIEDDCRSIAETCVQRYGRIDVLHNNVGTLRGDGGSVDLSGEDWQRLMDINLKGLFLTCKYVLPVMRAQRSGVIVNISSTAAVCFRPRTLAYKIAKAGINALTQNLALENAPYGVRVNAILPGLMDTPMAIESRVQDQGVNRDALRQERAAQVPLEQKMGSAWDVAAAAVFLASDEARVSGYITGVLLPVATGWGIECACGVTVLIF